MIKTDSLRVPLILVTPSVTYRRIEFPSLFRVAQIPLHLREIINLRWLMVRRRWLENPSEVALISTWLATAPDTKTLLIYYLTCPLSSHSPWLCGLTTINGECSSPTVVDLWQQWTIVSWVGGGWRTLLEHPEMEPNGHTTKPKLFT